MENKKIYLLYSAKAHNLYGANYFIPLDKYYTCVTENENHDFYKWEDKEVIAVVDKKDLIDKNVKYQIRKITYRDYL